MTRDPDLPTELWAVVARVARVWSQPRWRVRREWKYRTPLDAARHVAALAAWPDHAEIIGVWRADVGTWEPVDLDDLPPVPATPIPENGDT